MFTSANETPEERRRRLKQEAIWDREAAEEAAAEEERQLRELEDPSDETVEELSRNTLIGPRVQMVTQTQMWEAAQKRRRTDSEEPSEPLNLQDRHEVAQLKYVAEGNDLVPGVVYEKPPLPEKFHSREEWFQYRLHYFRHAAYLRQIGEDEEEEDVEEEDVEEPGEGGVNVKYEDEESDAVDDADDDDDEEHEEYNREEDETDEDDDGSDSEEDSDSVHYSESEESSEENDE